MPSHEMFAACGPEPWLRSAGLSWRGGKHQMRCFQSRAFVAAPSVQLPPSLRPTLRMVPRTTAERGGDARVSRLVPWVFRNEVSNFEELRTLGPALLVNVENADGHEVGVAVANLQTGGTSSINVLGRMLADNMNQTIDPPFFTLRIKRALQHRERVFQEPFYRLLNGEGDQVPGVVCDRYGDVLCVQFMAAAMQLLFEDQVCDALAEVLSPRTIIVRCDPLADRRLELAPMALPRVVRGTYEGPTVFLDSGFTFHSDLLAEHWSSGRYFAERDARTLAVKLAHELSSNGTAPQLRSLRVLGLGTDSVGLACAALGASSTFGEGLGLSLTGLEALANANGVDRFDTFPLEEPSVDSLGDRRAKFDLVSLEPPALAPSYGQVEEGMKRYSAWISFAAAAVRPRGFLMITCRSRTISAVRFMRCVNLGLWSARRRASLVRRSSTGPVDFPVHMALPDTKEMQMCVLRLQ